MKTVFLIQFCISAMSCLAQENLQFSKVIFIQMNADKVSNFIAKDTVLVVPEGKTWQITNTKVFMTYDNRTTGDKTYLYLNDCIITYANSQFAQHTDPIWLPAGKYRISIRTEEKSQREGRFDYSAFISGVEYYIPK